MEWSAWARAYDPLMRAGWLFVLVACNDSASKQQPAVAEVGGPTAIAAELGDKGYPCRRAVAFMTRAASDAVKERALPLIEQLCATWPPSDAVTPAITQQVLALVAATRGASLDEHGALSCDDAHAKITALLAALGCAEPPDHL